MPPQYAEATHTYHRSLTHIDDMLTDIDETAGPVTVDVIHIIKITDTNGGEMLRVLPPDHWSKSETVGTLELGKHLYTEDMLTESWDCDCEDDDDC